MNHEANCRWQMTTPEECVYRRTHHYCPHSWHACSCVKVPVSDHEPYGTCDWGDCNEEAVRWRYGDPEHGHLPVCLSHSLEQQAEAMQRAFDRIWRLTNLPFTDNDRKGIQGIAIAFIDGKGPQPGSQVAHLLAGDKEEHGEL